MGEVHRRFEGRAAAYEAARPTYPAEILHVLERKGFLRPGRVVADLGVGTGLLALHFVDARYTIFGVDPNAEMLAFASRRFEGRPEFEAVHGEAEATGLLASSIDLAVAAQAFHWFDPPALRAELSRILRPRAAVAWIWNSRHERGTPFLEAYEALLVRWGRDYAEVKARYADPEAMAHVAGRPVGPPIELSNVQQLSRAGLSDRLLSSSYLPGRDDPDHVAMLEEADAMFTRYAKDDAVELVYTTEIYAAHFSAQRT